MKSSPPLRPAADRDGSSQNAPPPADVPQFAPPPGAQSGEWLPRSARKRTTLLLARVSQRGGPDNLCRIRNISSGGAMIESERPLTLGAGVTLELRNGATLEGMIVWSQPGRAGVRFSDAVDVSRTLSMPIPDAALPASRRPRAPRLETRCTARIVGRGTPIAAVLTNLSQSGARLTLPPEACVPEATVAIVIPGLGQRAALLRWARGDDIGVSFLEPLPYREFSEWLGDPHRRFARN